MGKTVLAVDDSSTVRTMVTRALQPYGCRVIEATNGQEAVAAAEQHAPDLILLDITMPVMDGRQALVALRKSERCRAIPVIMLTAEGTKEIVLEIVRLGVSGYILKPFRQDTFDKEVSKVLGPAGTLKLDTVLVVDDSERVLAAARSALESTMTVLTAASAEEALARFQEGGPGVVVIDLVMPDVDGFETCARIRKAGRSACIALGVRGDEAVADKVRKAGFHSLVAKPFQAQVLVDAVRAAAGSLASPDDLVRSLVSEEGGIAIVRLPDPQVTPPARVLPSVRKALRTLAEDGRDAVVVDATALGVPDAGACGVVGQLVADATTLGIRVAICAADESAAAALKGPPALKDVPCVTDRIAAAASLAGAKLTGEEKTAADPAPAADGASRPEPQE